VVAALPRDSCDVNTAQNRGRRASPYESESPSAGLRVNSLSHSTFDRGAGLPSPALAEGGGLAPEKVFNHHRKVLHGQHFMRKCRAQGIRPVDVGGFCSARCWSPPGLWRAGVPAAGFDLSRLHSGISNAQLSYVGPHASALLASTSLSRIRIPP